MSSSSPSRANLPAIDRHGGDEEFAIAVDDWSKAIGHLRSLWHGQSIEQAAVIHCNGELGAFSIQHFELGTDHHVALDKRELLTGIATRDSEAVLLCHSHPVGHATPSRADIEATRNLARICTMLRVELVDHVILSDTDSFSFREAGLL